ncbi:MAG: hypothetical protein HY053_02910 [Proteobacteria bacterium]|nr:hypothetical protein [Pseudomonadota bacterium]
MTPDEAKPALEPRVVYSGFVVVGGRGGGEVKRGYLADRVRGLPGYPIRAINHLVPA